MSTEEKAKAYDEAIERAKNTIEVNQTIPDIVECVESLFPELKESEDERVRKELLKHLREVASGKSLELSTTDYERWATWVEKQGEHAKFRDSIQVGDKVTKNEDGVLVNLSQLKRVAKPAEEYNITGIGSKNAQGKLGEMIKNLKPVSEVLKQKPAFEMKTPEESLGIDSETYNEIVDECIYGDDDNKPAWSEEDNIMVHDIEYALRCQITYPISRLQSMSAWIFNLKNRVLPQPKQEWSEEDERFQNVAINILNSSKVYTTSPDKYEDTINWLKSLKDRYTWKPSDEQMTQLKKYCPDNRPLTSLYEQLKKLKG